MSPETMAILVFFGMVACLVTGYYLGFDWGLKVGKAKTMTMENAARIMAKASWARRNSHRDDGFFKGVNR